MKEQLSHILEQSVCLSRKQMKEYLSGSMLPEEVHAAELHISSCPLCSMAMEGFEEHSEDALAAIASLNSGFLKDHFDNIAPQIHLNSMAPAASLTQGARSSSPGSNTWIRPASIAAGLLLVCFGAWYLASRERTIQETTHEFARASTGPVNQLPTDNETGARTTATSVEATSTGNSSAPPSQSAPVAASSSIDKHANARNRAADHNGPATEEKPADPSLGAAYYYQPEPNAGDDPTKPARTPQTILPSANDPAKTYNGQISSRTSKMYVPEPAESSAATPLNSAAPVMHRSAMTKPAMVPPAPVAAEAAAAKPAAKRAEESSDQLYERGEYRSALTKYRQQIRSNDPEVRSHASLQAARCYAALGEPERAEELLRKVVDTGNGRDRRTARKLLRNLR